jgi:hypothetical protein
VLRNLVLHVELIDVERGTGIEVTRTSGSKTPGAVTVVPPTKKLPWAASTIESCRPSASAAMTMVSKTAMRLIRMFVPLLCENRVVFVTNVRLLVSIGR